MIITKGWKYRVEAPALFKLLTPLTLRASWESPWMAVNKESRLLLLKPGYAYNGADCFPDFDWVMTAAAGHDGLLQLIALGIIPESENDLVDKEFSLWVRGFPGAQTLMALRSWYVRKGTNLAQTRLGEGPKPVQFPRLPNELDIEAYRHLFML